VWRRLPTTALQQHLRPILLLLLPLYLLLVAWLVLAGTQGFADGAVVERLQTLRWLPLHRHYFVPEASAIRSLSLHLGIYAGVGLWLWLWDLRGRDGPSSGRAWYAAAGAALPALLLESGKLFLLGPPPDTAAPLLAALGAGVFYLLLCRIRGVEMGAPAPPRREGPVAVTLPARTAGLLMLGGAVVWAVQWPVAAPWLTAGLTAYTLWLWYRPAAWLLVVPALVPLLDLTLYTGHRLFDELDLMLLATAGVLLLRRPTGAGWPRLPLPVVWGAGLLALSTLLGLALALWPWPGFGLNDGVHYSSPWNGVRMARGVLWALLLFALTVALRQPPGELLRRWFIPGMALGAAAAVGVVLWERATYPGLLAVESRYRITGLFTDMHAGGPTIESFLVMTAPFLLLWGWRQRRFLPFLAAQLVWAGLLYGVVVTYSRAGYLGLTVALALLLPGALATGRDTIPGSWRRVAVTALLPLLLAAVVVPRAAGGFLEQRMSQVAQDWELREAHWRLAVALREGPPLLGAGMGRFPAAYAEWAPLDRMPENFAFTRAEGRGGLRLGSGDSLYLNQRLQIPRTGHFEVTVRARSGARARLRLFVCEKHVRHSFGCHQGRVVLPAGEAGTGQWRFETAGLASGPWFARRQLTLALRNETPGSVIELDRITLHSADGRQWLRNGTFAAGPAHWYFTTDHLWPYRVENQWLEVWFDQGWLGLGAFLLLTLAAMGRLARGGLVQYTLLAAVAGTLAIGLFSTIFWSPRIALLFYLTLLLGTAGRSMPDRNGVRVYA